MTPIEFNKMQFELLQTAAYHTADRAWAGLLSFFTAQSVLILAWAALLVVEKVPSRAVLMVVMSATGVLMCLQWAMLGTRMWAYHLGQIAKLEEIAGQNGFLPQFLKVKDVVEAEWRPGKSKAGKEVRRNRLVRVMSRYLSYPSSNQGVMFSLPAMFSILHMVMAYVAACCAIDGSGTWLNAQSCWSYGVWFGCAPGGFGLGLFAFVVAWVGVGYRCRRTIKGLDYRG